MNRRTVIKTGLTSLGYASIFGGLSSAFLGCTKEQATVEEALQILDPNSASTIGILADLFIPSSDTPGALEVGVVKGIDQYLAHFVTPQNQQVILGGLKQLDLLSQQLFQQNLSELESNQQGQIMQFLSNDANNTADKSTHLFFLIREMVVKAYFQSEIIAKTVLKYDPIPGEYKGCVPYDQIGGQWTL
ncbi:MAG: gluconate 2-dehydrogenase subunit 3 family protein [Bacteroidota bacterium]